MSFEQRYRAWRQQIETDKFRAKKCDLSLNQYLILKVLEDGEEHSFRDIVMSCGVYSNLPAELRLRHNGSLGSNGYVRENVFMDDNGKNVFTFQITKNGKKTLELADK